MRAIQRWLRAPTVPTTTTERVATTTKRTVERAEPVPVRMIPRGLARVAENRPTKRCANETGNAIRTEGKVMTTIGASPTIAEEEAPSPTIAEEVPEEAVWAALPSEALPERQLRSSVTSETIPNYFSDDSATSQQLRYSQGGIPDESNGRGKELREIRYIRRFPASSSARGADPGVSLPKSSESGADSEAGRHRNSSSRVPL